MINGALQVLDATWDVSEGPQGMQTALDRICSEAEQAIKDGVSYLIISDRATGRTCCAVLCCAAAHMRQAA